MFEKNEQTIAVLKQVISVLLTKKHPAENTTDSVVAALKRKEAGYLAVSELLSVAPDREVTRTLAEHAAQACICKIKTERYRVDDIEALNWALVYSRYGVTKETAEELIGLIARMGLWKHVERHAVDLIGLNRGVTVEEIKLLMGSYARAYQPDEKQHTALRAMARAAAGSAEEQEQLLQRIDEIHERVTAESAASDDCH